MSRLLGSRSGPLRGVRLRCFRNFFPRTRRPLYGWRLHDPLCSDRPLPRRRFANSSSSSPFGHLVRRGPGDSFGQGQLGHPARRIETGEQERANLTLLEDLARLGRRGRAHRSEGDVAVQHPAGGERYVDHRTVGRERHHFTFHGAADGERGHEVDEGERFVDRRCGVVPRCFFFRDAGVLPADGFFPTSFLALPPTFGVAAISCLVAFGLGGCRASSTASSIALTNTGSTFGWTGGGVAGTNGHEVERGTEVFVAFFADFDLLAAFLAARASSAAFMAAESWSFFDRASAVAARLLGPRMGSLGVKIQPTPGTGFPPIRRPSSKSHGCSPWNSWNESLERTTALVRSAMRRTKASPRPMAPAGGDTMSPSSIASRTVSRSDSETRCSNVASTTTMMLEPGSSAA